MKDLISNWKYLIRLKRNNKKVCNVAEGINHPRVDEAFKFLDRNVMLLKRGCSTDK